ncbi:unnamed protein product [Penicillium salamii]|uniref:Uncharacterized protein n=1 Tax=Penicillium salamii TaxID=1612424 RepID=A0A9W4K390_9EURO|nr:unnamed protein product [Penicillium salamii]CAG8097893.1 unnamed protein product [Penicillium salamii]CAG8297415.1 unnamed protein product [Penicillium salamii]CAG8326273.1 unnamed protein product [Penicillium salamii]CAG8417233.1 unnamed protein product [Penicillium salamii]
MGTSSPPFLYDRPADYSFKGPTDRGFNPRAATEASWSQPAEKPKPKGPLVNFNRHPDTWGSFNTATSFTPMNPRTKDRVKYARTAQLVLRVITLLGALGSLFCSIVIKGAAATIIWIIRAGPIVAILHTIYGIVHNSRSVVNRPAGSQASYGVFASTLDFGLVPFYVFTAYIAYEEWTSNAYKWGTLFNNSDITPTIAETTFILALANGAFHLVSLAISIFLAVTFRKITRLPPDMNPLEDNLTARPRKSRKEADADEKHLSQSTMGSSFEDPLIGSPRSVPFLHTREQSLGDSNRGSMTMAEEQRQSYPPVLHHRLSHLESPTEPSSPEMLFHHPASQPFDLTSTSPTPTPEYRKVASHAPEIINATAQMRHLSSRTADRSDTVSPLSDNWVAYSERSMSPDAQNMNENTLRQSSSVYSRQTEKTSTSTGSGLRDWFAYGSKPTPSIGSAIPEDVRGEYASLAMHEYYGVDDHDYEQDVGDQRMDIFPDPEEHNDDFVEDRDDSIPFNPLMLNPPTPQPILSEISENTDPVRRVALSDHPNLSYNENTQPVSVPHESPNPSSPKSRFYGELDVDGKPGLGLDREPSVQLARKPTKLTKKQSKKMSAYAALKKDDSGDEAGYLSPKIPTSPRAIEGDRKGRVVSNTGADTARPSVAAGVGASLSSYGSYIAGLGVGRRRDVSGKVAEEGRSAPVVEELVQNPTPTPSPTRAAGWARFAGL